MPLDRRTRTVDGDGCPRCFIRALRAAKPMAVFPVYCGRSRTRAPCGRYYMVLIVNGRERLAACARAITGKRGWSRTVGMCHSCRIVRLKDGRWRAMRLAGFVLVRRRYVCAGIVSHELTHAAHFEMLRRFPEARLDDAAVQEPLAWLQGWLTTQFWKSYYARFAEEPAPRALKPRAAAGWMGA